MKTSLVQPVRARALSLCFAVLALAAACAPAGVTSTTAPASSTTVAVSPAGPSPTLPAPSATPTVALTATHQPTPKRSTPTPVLTEAEPNASARVSAVMTAEPARTLKPYRSPNGHWQAASETYDCIQVAAQADGKVAYERMLLSDLTNGETKPVEDPLINCGGLGAYGLAGLFWSADSRYFYYTNARTGGPDGWCDVWWYRPATRLELATGAKVALVQGPVSVDGLWQAGIAASELVLWNRDSGQIIRTPVATAGFKAGDVTWAPDGKSLAYIQWSDCSLSGGESSLALFDRVRQQQSILLPFGRLKFLEITWEVQNQLSLWDVQHEWRYNLVTKTLTAFS